MMSAVLGLTGFALFSVHRQSCVGPTGQGHSFCHIEMLSWSPMTTLGC